MLSAGVERELGGATHDGSVRGRERGVRMSVRRLQGGPRVHRRVHILVDAFQGGEPDAERRPLPQTDRWLVVTCVPRESKRALSYKEKSNTKTL